MTEIVRTILLIDDREENRENYDLYLLPEEQYAYRIIVANNGKQALELCSEQFPDAIVLNYLLLALDGLEILSKLKALRGTDDLPVILLTGQGSEEIAVQALEGGADYLVKDKTTSESLRLAIHQMLERMRLKQQLEESQAVLPQARDELERRVVQRTAELEQANQELQVTLEELQVAEEEVRSSNEELACARKAVELERQRYQDLFEQAPDGYLVTDIWGKIQAANRAAAALFGVNKNYLIGKPLVNYIAPSERQTFRTRLAQLQQVQDWEVYVQPRLGTPFPVTLAVTSMHDSQGQLVGWRWLLHDITERKQMQLCLQAAHDNLEKLVTERTAALSQANAKLQQEIRDRKLAEASLQASEVRYRTIAELTSDYIYSTLITPEGTAVEEWATPNLSRITGYTHKEFFDGTRTWRDIIHPDDLPTMRQFFARLLQQQHSGTLEYRIVTKHGEVRWIRDRIQPQWDDAEKRVVRVLGAVEDISDRKLAEVGLRESEAKYRTLFDSIDEGFILCDVIFDESDRPEDILYVEANAAATRMTGQELTGRRMSEIDPNFESHWFEIFGRVARTGAAVRIELPAAPLNAWYEIYIFRANDANNQRVAAVYKDITARKQMERERERFLAVGSDLQVITGSNGYFHWVSPTFEQTLGWTIEEMTSRPWTEFVHPDDINPSVAEVASLFSGRETLAFENRYRHKNGSYRWLLWRTQPYPEEQVIYWAAVDITERKQAEQKIQEQAKLLDVATDAIFVRDLEHRVLYWNCGAERLYGWQAAEVLGRNCGEFLYKQISPQMEEAFRTVVEQGEWQGELDKIAKSGQEIIVQSRWTLLRDSAGQPRSILAVDTDITEKKQLQVQFYRTQRLESLGILASGIAHDLNNILQPILITAQLLKLKSTDADERYQQLLLTLETSAKRGADVVKQILTFARGAEGKRASVQVRHLLKDIEQLAKQTFPKSIEITTDIPPDLWAVFADTTQLHQVLMNLVVNARDAMPDGGTLSLSAANLRVDETYAKMNIEAKVGSYIVVTVADTGCGIAPEIIDRIFDPFFTTKELGQGTGLGLSTVLGIIKNHGGFVQLESQVGLGTQFRVYLPTGVCNAEQQSPELELLAGQGELILIVDDEVAVQQITKTSLEAYNYKTLVASNGIEAIAFYAERQQKIDVVLMDMMMPSMDGLTAIRTLQRMNPQVKIIATSGVASNSQLAEAAGISAQAVLSKPYTIKELLDILNRILTAR